MNIWCWKMLMTQKNVLNNWLNYWRKHKKCNFFMSIWYPIIKQKWRIWMAERPFRTQEKIEFSLLNMSLKRIPFRLQSEFHWDKIFRPPVGNWLTNLIIKLNLNLNKILNNKNKFWVNLINELNIYLYKNMFYTHIIYYI